MDQRNYTDIRNAHKEILKSQGISPSSIDVFSNLYYDETGNIKKFVVREESFNVDANTHFVLGGIEGDGSIKFEDLKNYLGVQPSVTKEIKSKHVYTGTFEWCLKSKTLERFLDLIIERNWHIHFHSLNLLYWSIVDILDSIENITSYGSSINELKSMLYRVAKHNAKATARLFYDYQYPNLKTADEVKAFFQGVYELCKKYEEHCPQNLQLLLKILLKIITEGSKQDEAIFIQDETDHLLIKELTNFYEFEIYTYINSNLIFDNEADIIKDIKNCEYIVDNNVLSRYYFVDSKSDCMIQLSDIFVGIMAKYLHAIDVNLDNLNSYIKDFDGSQLRRFRMLNRIIKSSLEYNPPFIHQTTSIELHSALIKLINEYY